MGMFDSLLVDCLFCGKEIEEQTKSGPCALQYYKWTDPNLPIWMMQEFNGAEVECYHCYRKFRIVLNFEIIVKDRRLETINNLDTLELEVERRERKEKEEEQGG